MIRTLARHILPLVLVAAGACGSTSSTLPPESVPDASCPTTAEMPPPGETPDLSIPPTPPDRRFTVAMIPDTQYLFDGDRGDPNVLKASLQWIVDNTAKYNIVFTAQLDEVFQIFDQHHIQYSVVPGNHDLAGTSSTDDQRGGESYSQYFSPTRFSNNPTFGGSTANGFDTYYVFDGGGQKWLLFALDWRASAATLAWAEGVIAQHPTLPVIVTCHELVYDGGNGTATPTGQAVLSPYGQTVWDGFLKKHDQVFLTVNGHFWPPARTVLKNAAGHDVNLQIANYQDRYYGGSAMIRLYRFDPDNNSVEVSTFSPFMLNKPAATRNAFEQQEAVRNDDNDHFVMSLDFANRFRDFQVPPVAPPMPVPAAQVVIPGTVAYWRFEGGTVGQPLADTGVVVNDLSGNGNHLTRVTLQNGKPGDLVWSSAYHPLQPSRSSLFLNGSKTTPALGGAYLRTADGAKMNGLTFTNGYTVEAFLKLPADCCGDNHAWMGVLSRMGVGAEAQKTGDDPLEPVTNFAISPGRELQWAVFPTNLPGIETNWSHILPAERWTHVALVNDGHHTVLYTDGAPGVRNPRSDSIGLTTNGEYWLVGATHYARGVSQSFYGWIGDVRIVDHALTVPEFMISHP